MPFLLPRTITDSKRVFVLLAYGDLSYLEVCSVLSRELVGSKLICDEIAEIESKETLDKVQRLAGIFKLAVPLGEVVVGRFEAIQNSFAKVLNYFDDKQNFCVSLYCAQATQDEYDFLVSNLLQMVREGGFGKANLIRPHSGYELHSDDIIARKAIEFIVFPSAKGYHIGATSYVSDSEKFRDRATKRPVVSSRIALAPRLARLLVNLGHVAPHGLLLDPFCGSGTILGEAMLDGIDCMGIDRDPNSTENTEMNLAWIRKNSGSRRIGSFETRVGDATRLSEILKDRQVDAIVTEPILLPSLTSTPGLKAARSMIRNASATYSDFLYSARDVLRKGGRLVVVVPGIRTSDGKEVHVTLEEVESIGFREFQPLKDSMTTYPTKVGLGSTRWVRRMVYVFERI